MVTAAIKLKDTCSWEEKYDKPSVLDSDSVLKRRHNTLLTKVHIVKMIFFFSSNVQM